MNAPLYTTEILRLAASLEPPRELHRVDGRAELRSRTCGSAINTAVMLDPEGRVEGLSQAVSACAFGQASAALVQRASTGRGKEEVGLAIEALSDWLQGERDDPGSWPGLASLSPARRKVARHAAILLPFQALLQAMSR